MTKVKLIISLTCTSMVFWALYSWNLQKPHLGQSIVAHVELRNACEISDDYLVLYDTDTGARARFMRGKARLSTQYGNILTIKLDRAAKGLLIPAPNAPAQQKVMMKIECDTSFRFDEIKKSLRDELN